MKKNLKRMFALVMAFTILLSLTAMLTGCGESIDDPDRFSEKVDESKTQLYVGYFNGGIGLKWITEAKRLFEELHPEIQIMIDTGKDEYASDLLMSNIKTNRQDIYLTDGIAYYKYVNKGGLLADLTEATTTPLTEYGEDKSIADKMNTSLNAFFQTKDGKYYAAPYYQSYHHIIYDVDLFDQYSLWFKDGGGFVSSTADKKSAGQDGEFGTWDDGLPVTYSDFFAMMDRMVARGITPITWSGATADAYLPNFMASLIADYEGDQYNTNWCYDGEIDVITNRDFTESAANTFTLSTSDYETVTVTPENFKDYMHSTVGKYYAAKFAKDLCSNSQYRKYNYAESHTAVQRSFLMSNMEGVDAPIAMLIEGGWWMNEATSVFDEMKVYDEKYAKENRRFGVMPFPKADDGSSAEGHTVSPFSGQSAVFISENSTKKDIAIEFYRFLHTDQCLKVFAQMSGVLRPYECDFSGIYDSVPYYVQNVIDSAADTNFIFRVSTGDMYKENAEVLNFMMYDGLMATNWNNIASANMMIFFCDNVGATAKDYLLGMKGAFEKGIPGSLR